MDAQAKGLLDHLSHPSPAGVRITVPRDFPGDLDFVSRLTGFPREWLVWRDPDASHPEADS